MNEIAVTHCSLCPRTCHADRTKGLGFCGAGSQIRIARAALHFGEEPCISGSCGSGTVFFSDCPLRCCYCQNAKISREHFGKEISVRRLADVFLELAEQGAHNLNLVSPTQYRPWIQSALDLVKHRLQIPVVYNTSGYETQESIQALKGYVEIYLTDYKYADTQRAARYSAAETYPQHALHALYEMAKQTGVPSMKNGILQTGTIVRHLVLPGGRHDSLQVLDQLANTLAPEQFLLSLMRQYTPVGVESYPELQRRVTTFEYQCVLNRAAEYGFQGYMQERDSATLAFTPAFDLTGVEAVQTSSPNSTGTA